MAPIVLIMALLGLPDEPAQEARQDIVFGYSETFESTVLGESRTLFIHLPEDYAELDTRYPVLYVLDGHFDALFAEGVAAAEYLRLAGQSEGIIVVGVESTENRDRNTLPPRRGEEAGAGGVDDFLSFLQFELKPYINRSLRTRRGQDILYGASNSALFALYVLLTEPSAFSSYIAASPMIGHRPALMHELLEDARRNAEAFHDARLFIGYGESDDDGVLLHIDPFAEALSREPPGSIRFHLELVRGQGHVPFGTIFSGLAFFLSGG